MHMYMCYGLAVTTGILRISATTLAFAVLDVYLSILCMTAKAPVGCEGLGDNTAAAAIQHW